MPFVFFRLLYFLLRSHQREMQASAYFLFVASVLQFLAALVRIPRNEH